MGNTSTRTRPGVTTQALIHHQPSAHLRHCHSPPAGQPLPVLNCTVTTAWPGLHYHWLPHWSVIKASQGLTAWPGQTEYWAFTASPWVNLPWAWAQCHCLATVHYWAITGHIHITQYPSLAPPARAGQASVIGLPTVLAQALVCPSHNTATLPGTAGLRCPFLVTRVHLRTTWASMVRSGLGQASPAPPPPRAYRNTQ